MKTCKERYKETSKLINGYSQMNSMPRALGFKDSCELQSKLHKFNHLINAEDVETVCKWLFEQGFDIIPPIEDKEKEPKVYYCSVCHKNIVDAENGYDTCESCVNNV